MDFKSITATISIHMVEQVEERLREISVPGLTVSKAEGYGAHKNFFQRDLLSTHARLQIYSPEIRVAEIVEAIMNAGSMGLDDDGIIIVSPVEAIYRIADKVAVDAEEI